MIISEGKNKRANELFSMLDFAELSEIDIDGIMGTFTIFNPYLRKFLKESREAMQDNDLNELKDIIQRREVFLKGINRSKTAHPGEYDINEWFAGEHLDYRFYTAKNIIADIYDSEESDD